MSNANDGHVTYPMNRQNAEWKRYAGQVDRFVENHYGHVMPPYQRKLVKQIVLGEDVSYARPFIKRVCERTAREVVAVISAGQSHFVAE